MKTLKFVLGLLVVFVSLVYSPVAYAGQPLGEGTYQLTPGGGTIVVESGGASLLWNGIRLTWNGSSGKYEGEPASCDTMEFFIEGGANWESWNYPEPPNQGPPIVLSGGGVTYIP